MAGTSRGGRRLIEVALVLMLVVLAISVLLPSLSTARRGAMAKRMAPSTAGYHEFAAVDMTDRSAPPARPAKVNSFVAEIDLNPKLSVGTADPESIYEARFHAAIQAAAEGNQAGTSIIELPLPPTLISLADLTFTVNGDPSDQVSIEGDKLLWKGQLPAEPSNVDVTYSAMGKGIYTLKKPSEGIIDSFQTTLTANGSDVRMLELSLQPNKLDRQSGNTVYTWKYDRLMLARPIALDVLGIAPMDRLGELTWLAPVSLVIFGVLTALLILATRPERLEKWMFLLVVGTFAGAYPLMYFAQEFLAVRWAALLAGTAVLAIILIRALTLLGARAGIALSLLAAAMLTITVYQALRPAWQGILLTVEAILTFVVAMILLPKAQRAVQPVPPPLPENLVQK